MGLVPTMGALHEGHLTLLGRSVADNDVTVVSIFVNPTQFAPGDDLDEYPRQFEEDVRKCEELGVDIVFAPTATEMYDGDFSTFVEETHLAAGLCGAARPGHFRGVTTVVMKLFNIVRPERAYFGQKDAQQAAVIKRMVRDLDMAVEIVMMPIVREADGLAMSSRNVYLSPDERSQALVLSRALGRAEGLVAAGESNSGTLKEAMREVISTAPLARIDYVEIIDDETLEPIDRITHRALAALAVFVGETRLIDNRILPTTSNGENSREKTHTSR